MPSADLPFSRTAHDRSAHRRAEADLLDALRKEPTTRVLLVQEGKVATSDGVALFAPDDVAHLPADAYLYLGQADGVAYLAAVLDGAAMESAASDGTWSNGTWSNGAGAPPTTTADALGVDWTGLRALAVGDLEQGLAVEAVALARWHATHTRCPRCGTATDVVQGGWVRVCPADGSNHFPRTDPAVIMAVVDPDERLLLARNPQWAPGRRSVLAGFVEPGEGLEQAVARETAEEVGVTLDPRSIEYRGSQSWPFPASLMMGFLARATTTRLVRQEDEIAEAGWFTRDEVATAVADGELGLPGRTSIARSLIEEWYGGPVRD